MFKENTNELPKLSTEDEKILDELAKKVKEVLGEKIKDVKISKRLSDHAVWLSGENEMFSASFRRRMVKGSNPMFDSFVLQSDGNQ